MLHPPTAQLVHARIALSFAALLALGMTLSCGGSEPPTSSGNNTPPPPPPPAPVILLSSPALQTSLVAGSAASTLDLDVTAGSGSAVNGLSVQDASVPAAPWLSFTLSSASAPAKISVKVDPSALGAGTYSGSLRVSATGADAKTVQVTLTVTPRAKLVVDRAAISVTAGINSTVPAQSINLTSSSGVIDGLSLSAPRCSGSLNPWLTATLSSPKTPATVTFALNPAGLVVASYSCAVTIATNQAVDDATQDVNVTMNLQVIPRIALSRDTVFLTVPSGLLSPATTVNVSNSGSGNLGVLSLGAVSYTGTTGWLTASLAGAVVSLTANATSLPIGSYYATIPVQSSAANVANSPKPLTVALTVVAPLPTLIATPAAIVLSRKFGTSTGMSASTTITHSGSTSFTNMGFGTLPSSLGQWNVTVLLGCPGIPGSGVFTTPCTLQVDALPSASLPVGTYALDIPVRSYDNAVSLSVPVSIVITP